MDWIMMEGARVDIREGEGREGEGEGRGGEGRGRGGEGRGSVTPIFMDV